MDLHTITSILLIILSITHPTLAALIPRSALPGKRKSGKDKPKPKVESSSSSGSTGSTGGSSTPPPANIVNTHKDEGKKDEGKKDEGKKDEGKKDDGKKDEGKKDDGKKDEGKKDDGKKDEGKKDDKKDKNKKDSSDSSGLGSKGFDAALKFNNHKDQATNLLAKGKQFGEKVWEDIAGLTEDMMDKIRDRILGPIGELIDKAKDKMFTKFGIPLFSVIGGLGLVLLLYLAWRVFNHAQRKESKEKERIRDLERQQRELESQLDMKNSDGIYLGNYPEKSENFGNANDSYYGAPVGGGYHPEQGQAGELDANHNHGAVVPVQSQGRNA